MFVDGIVGRLAYQFVGEGAFLGVEHDKPVVVAWPLLIDKFRIAFDLFDGIRRHHHNHVNLVGEQRGDPCCRFGNRHEDQLFGLGFALFPVVRIAFQYNLLPLHPLNKAERTGTDRVFDDRFIPLFAHRLGADHTPGPITQKFEKGCVWLIQGHTYRVLIQHFHIVEADQEEANRIGRVIILKLLVKGAAKGEFDRRGIKGLTIVKGDTLAQFEGILGGIF